LMGQCSTEEELYDLCINSALENIDEANPKWTYLASNIYLKKLYKEAATNRNYAHEQKYGDFYTLIKLLTEKGIYTPLLLEKYSQEEITYFGSKIDPTKDELFHYLALYTLATRYLATDHDKNVYELP